MRSSLHTLFQLLRQDSHPIYAPGFTVRQELATVETNLQQTLNVLGTPLATCSTEPLTGYFRNGCCETAADDSGRHVVCAIVTEDFLLFSRLRGNDLITPRLEFNFPGLLPGDRWCLCVNRWLEAHHAGVAPPVVLEATHAKTLESVDLETLRSYADVVV